MTMELRRLFMRLGWLGLLLAVCALTILDSGPQVLAAGQTQQVTLVMKEFKFEPATVHLKVGETVVLTLKNEGTVEHEWSAGQNVVDTAQQKGYRRDLFTLLKPRVTGKEYELERVSAPASATDMSAEGETAKMLSTELDVQPGGSAVLRFTVPASAKGTWQFGCFVTGHYESGMKGTLVID